MANANPSTDNPAITPLPSADQIQLAYASAIELSQFRAGFLARTSHELRSPLNGLISGLQLILSDLCDDPAEEREYVRIAHDSALKLVEILDQVITVSRASAGSYPFKLETVDLDIALQEVAYLVKLQAENRNLKLHVPDLDAEINVKADANCLRQALVMLLDGAIALMQEGHINVAVTTIEPMAQIVIADDRPMEAWAELRAMFAANASIETVNPQQAPVPALSPNFRLILAKELLEAIGGRLELIEIDGKTQLQCSLPLA
jgi:signal transduction histidine kinase